MNTKYMEVQMNGTSTIPISAKRMFVEKWHECAIHLAVLAIFLIIGIVKFYPILTSPLLCLSETRGDGIGAIGGIYSFKEYFDKEGVKALYGATFPVNQNIGFGLTGSAMWPYFWKTQMFILTHIFDLSPKNVYNFIGLLSFVLIGYAGFLLVLELGGGYFFSILAGLLFCHSDAFYGRLGAHLLGLGSFYPCLLLAWASIRAAKKPSLRRLLVFACLLAFNFNSNEYYGYFGFFFSAILFATYALIFKTFVIDGGWKRFTTTIFISLSAFTFFMCVLYPDMVFWQVADKIYSVVGSTAAGSNMVDMAAVVHPFGEFDYYSAKNPLTVLSSTYSPWNHLLEKGITLAGSPGEFTFRTGLFVILLPCCFLILCLLIQLKKKSISSDSCYYMKIFLSFLPACLLMYLFSTPPSHWWSLVPLTYKIAPMFRVSLRSWIYIDIAVISMFCLCGGLLLKRISDEFTRTDRRWRWMPHAAAILLASYSAIVVFDLAGTRIINSIPCHRLPDVSFYEKIKEYPRGLLLELPCETFPPETSYILIYNRIAHACPIANVPWFPPTPKKAALTQGINAFTSDINTYLSDDLIDDLRKSGVRYLAIDKTGLKLQRLCLT
jgi:hypothetical protein